jgi:hypothetical protein
MWYKLARRTHTHTRVHLRDIRCEAMGELEAAVRGVVKPLWALTQDEAEDVFAEAQRQALAGDECEVHAQTVADEIGHCQPDERKAPIAHLIGIRTLMCENKVTTHCKAYKHSGACRREQGRKPHRRGHSSTALSLQG